MNMAYRDAPAEEPCPIRDILDRIGDRTLYIVTALAGFLSVLPDRKRFEAMLIHK